MTRRHDEKRWLQQTEKCTAVNRRPDKAFLPGRRQPLNFSWSRSTKLLLSLTVLNNLQFQGLSGFLSAPPWISGKVLGVPFQRFQDPFRGLPPWKNSINLGGDETRSGYKRYIKGIQPNVPTRTTCRHGLYNSMVRARAQANPACAHTSIPLSSA